MPKVLLQNANINVYDDPQAGRGPQMEIEGHQGFMAYVRHYPNKWDKLTASIGSIALGGGGTKSNIYEWLSFSNSTEVSTQYPVTSVASWGVYGSVEDVDGNWLPPNNIVFDKDGSKFVAKIPCYADVEIEYHSAYTTLKYLQQITGNTMKYGVIRSRLNGQVAQFRVPAPVLVIPRIELCRVISYYVISELGGVRGSYEMPDNFPTNLGYPVTPQKIEEEGSLKVERAHQIIHTDTLGVTTTDLYYTQLLKPYENYGTSYNPKYLFKKNESPGDEWSGVFSKIKWAPLFESLSQKYPGLVEE